MTLKPGEKARIAKQFIEAIPFSKALGMSLDDIHIVNGTFSQEFGLAATTQLINTVMEGWIREYPEQWLWLHRRWRATKPRRRVLRNKPVSNAKP